MNTTKIAPRHKLDFERADLLTQYSFDELYTEINEILEWASEVNDPIYRKVVAALLPYMSKLEAEITLILKTKDAVWCRNLLEDLVYKSGMPIGYEFDVLLHRIAYYPTLVEIEEETDLAAQLCIERVVLDWDKIAVLCKFDFSAKESIRWMENWKAYLDKHQLQQLATMPNLIIQSKDNALSPEKIKIKLWEFAQQYHLTPVQLKYLSV